MTGTEQPPMVSIRRVLVALGVGDEGTATLEAAAELAARLEAEVVGLFVEDINLLHLAALPFARELGAGSATGRSLDPVHMERSLRARAEAMRQALAACASRARIPWSFQVRRGDLVEELLATSPDADLLVFGEMETAIVSPGRAALTQRLLLQCGCAVLRRGTTAIPRRPVVLYYDGSPQCRRALSLARRLAGTGEKILHVLLPPADPETRRALETQVRGQLGGGRPQPKFHHLGDLESATVARAVAEAGGDLLIISSACPIAGSRNLEALLEKLRCDLLLVR